MSTTVVFTNYSDKLWAHPGIGIGVPAFSGTTPGSVSKVYKQVNADDYDMRFDVLAALGLAVSEDGTDRPGVEVDVSGAAFTPALTSHIVVVDTDADGLTMTLQPAGDVGAGFKMWIFVRVDGGGDLTVEGDGAETVLGAANQVLADAGDLLAIVSDGTNWIAQ